MATQQVGAVGIDFGSYRSVIAVAKKKGVDVITNQASHRDTPNIVGYGQKERFLGEQGAVRAKSNFKNTCSFSNRLLGLKGDYSKIKEETKWITSKVVTREDQTIVYDVTNQGEKAQYTPTQVVGAMLGELRKIITFNDIGNKEAVVSVPSYFTEQEKKALLDAAQIAGLKINRLISEDSATAISYGLFRKADLPDKDKEPRNVVFIDFGHSKLSSYVASFTKEKCQVILQENERHLGARDFDWTLLEFYDKIFQEQNQGLSILENKKSILRCLDAIQKQRSILSANVAASISAECLVEDCDLGYDMTRDQFQELIKPELERIRASLIRLREQIEKKQIKIDHVEIVGGASRTPIVQEIIQEVFQMEICKTLNQTECIAKGCAMMAAYLSPQFRVAEYQLEECNHYPIKIQWNFLNNGNMTEEGKTAIFFDRGCSIPNIKSLTFQRTDGIQLNMFYDPAPEGFQSQLTSISIPAVDPKEMDYSIKIRIKLNMNGIVEMTECCLIEKYKEEIKVKKPKQEKPADDKKDEKKEGEQQEQEKKEEDEYEIKIKDKQRNTDVNCTTASLYYLSTQDMEDQFNKESELVNHDRIIQETQHKKNELETYIYEWRDRITGNFKDFTDQSKVPEFQQKLQQHQDWLENDGQHSSKGQYQTKIDELKALFDSIQTRQKQYENIPYTIEELQKTLKTATDFVASTEEKYAHITAEERAPITAEVQKAQAKLAEAQSSLQNTPKHQNLPISIEDLNQVGLALINLTTPVMNKPVPKKEEPKKEEEAKAEEPKQEQQAEQKEQEQKQQGDKMEVE